MNTETRTEHKHKYFKIVERMTATGKLVRQKIKMEVHIGGIQKSRMKDKNVSKLEDTLGR